MSRWTTLAVAGSGVLAVCIFLLFAWSGTERAIPTVSSFVLPSAMSKAPTSTGTIISPGETGGAVAIEDRSSPVVRLPAPGTPLADVYERLQRRANDGDKAAADRLYTDTMRCLDYLRTKAAARGQLIETWGIANGKLERTAPAIDRNEALLGELQQKIEANSPLCSAVDQEYLDKIMYGVILAAAKAGNQAAATCYVSAPFSSSHRVKVNPELVAEYRMYGRRFAKAGIRAGDWAMVKLLAAASGAVSDSDPSLLYRLLPHNKLLFYSYLSLEQLGADQASLASVEQFMQATLAQNDFSADQVQTAEQWASYTYQRYFSDKPSYSERGSVCGQSSYIAP